jgi:hypothetical protein
LAASAAETVRPVGELVSEVVTSPDVAALFRNAEAAPAQAARAGPSPVGGLLGQLAGWLRRPLHLARQAWRCACDCKGALLAGLAAVAACKAGPLLALAGLAGAAA